MKNLILVFLVSFLFGISCTHQNQKSDWNQVDLRLEKVFILPDSTSQDSAIYFFHPDFVVTDTTGTIIIADKALNKLFRYDKEGRLLSTFGKRGPGPSEFRSINGMSINKFDEVLVFDRSSQSIKKFNSSGDYIDSYKMQTTTVDLEFEEWKNNYLLFYLNDLPENINQNNLVHIYSSDFELLGDHIPYNNIDLLNSDLLISYVSAFGNSHFVKEDSLFFAPTLYNGYIYHYTIKETTSGRIDLKYTAKINGLTYIEAPAKKYDGDKLSYADATISMAGGRKSQILFHNQSKGLFQLNNGLIVHFTFIEKSNPHKRVFGIELYDQRMNPIGYSPIKEITFDSKRSNLLSWNVVWKDKLDRFYIVDKDSKGPPVIRVVKLVGLNNF